MKAKRFLTVALSVSLLAGSANASTSLKDMFLKNSTPPSNANIGGTHYYSGGSFNLKFKDNSYAFKPWINGEPPRFHMGCNGISLSGGFISLLGLNDIKDQINHAVVAFAWGVIMAIKATIPLVAQVFEALQKWARTIQKLLQNACAMGQALASNNPMVKNLNNKLTEYASSKGYKKVKDDLGSFSAAADTFSNWIDNSIDGNKTAAKAMTGQLITSLTKGKTISLATLYFGSYLPKPTNSDAVFYTDDLYDIYHKKIDGIDLSVSDDTAFDKAVLFHKLAILCFGEIGISKADFNKLTKIVDASSDASGGGGTGKLNKNKLKGAGLKALSEGITLMKGFNSIPIKSVLDTSNIYDFLIKGAKSVSSTACDNTGKCTIPDYKVLYIYTKTESAVNSSGTSNASTSSSKSKNILKVFTLVEAEGSHTITLQWDGFFQPSLDYIRNEVKTEAGLTTYKFLNNSAPSTTPSSSAIILPGINKYINILGLLAKKQGGEDNYIYYLENLLAQRNAQAEAFLFVNNLASYIQTLEKDPSVTIGKGAQQALQNYLTKVENTRKIMYKQLLGKLKVDTSLKDLDDIFNSIYKNIKQQSLQSVGF